MAPTAAVRDDRHSYGATRRRLNLPLDEMAGKAKPKKHTAKELASKAAAALTNKGGGAAGLADRKGGAAGHAKVLLSSVQTGGAVGKERRGALGLEALQVTVRLRRLERSARLGRRDNRRAWL
jgi:hypothetical protein